VLSLDVTDRKQMEATLRRAHKLRALGEMAVGVAHDLRNILNPLSLQLQLLQRLTPQEPRVTAIAGEMLAVVRRGTQTIDRLREFGRQTPTTDAPVVDLSAVAREALVLCRPRVSALETPIRMVEELAESVPTRVSAAELIAAIVNVVFNAIDAMPEGGTLTIRTGASDDRVCVEVEDTGTGMPPEVEARAFQPFFTTKGEHGTGMGLAMAYALVTRHHGTAGIRTAPGKGTAITLRFPRASATGAGEPVSAVRAPGATSSGD